jgi:2-keto-4-pentenoate hydratase/2-oxohepta-3-ene-1,7-dioic acid hydratase in catechol pathway
VRLLTAADGGAAILTADGGQLPVARLNRTFGVRFPERVGTLVRTGGVFSLTRWVHAQDPGRLGALADPADPAGWRDLFVPRGKLWGIGLNYAEHQADLGAPTPDEPASFLRPADTVLRRGRPIRLPPQSRRVTAEAELGLVFGRRLYRAGRAQALAAVAGAVPLLDMTAEDILERNPRFLTRAKSFDTFFAFGPVLATLDEFADLDAVTVATVRNGAVVRQNRVGRMRFDPAHLVAFHSHVFAWRPGDILATGTPGAAVIRDGDTVEARVADLPPLALPVVGPSRPTRS